MTEHVHENENGQAEETEKAEVGYFPPDSLVIPRLRQEIANLNDSRLMLTQQVEFQASIIESLQSQLQVSMSQIEAAGIEIETVPMVQPVE